MKKAHEQTADRDKTADVKMSPRAFSAIFFVSSVLHMLIHGAIVTVEALGPAKTSKFGNLNTDQTWLRCNIPFYRAVVVAGVHLLLSVAGWLGCVHGSGLTFVIYSIGTTFVVSTATPLTLLPLLTACGGEPSISVPVQDVAKIGVEVVLQIGFGVLAVISSAIIPFAALSRGESTQRSSAAADFAGALSSAIYCAVSYMVESQWACLCLHDDPSQSNFSFWGGCHAVLYNGQDIMASEEIRAVCADLPNFYLFLSLSLL